MVTVKEASVVPLEWSIMLHESYIAAFFLMG